MAKNSKINVSGYELTELAYGHYVEMYYMFKGYAPRYNSLTPADQKSFVRRIFGGGAMFHAAPKGYHMGLVSQAYVEGKRNGTYTKDSTADHTTPVTVSAEQLLQTVEGMTEQEFVAKCVELSGTIRVTKEENDMLRSFQKTNSGLSTWQEQYEAAGIVLVEMSLSEIKKLG